MYYCDFYNWFIDKNAEIQTSYTLFLNDLIELVRADFPVYIVFNTATTVHVRLGPRVPVDRTHPPPPPPADQILQNSPILMKKILNTVTKYIQMNKLK